MHSVLTDDMDHCIFTGSPNVERHHIFYRMGGGMKKKCEKYGFIAPLRPDLHPNGVHAGEHAKDVDLWLKTKSQEYYEAHYGSQERFVQEFGKSYIGVSPQGFT